MAQLCLKLSKSDIASPFADQEICCSEKHLYFLFCSVVGIPLLIFDVWILKFVSLCCHSKFFY